MLKNLLDLIFPKYCFYCLKRTNNFILCDACLAKLNLIKEEDKEKVVDCHKLISLYQFDEIIRSLMHELKYSEMISIAKFFSDNIFLNLKNDLLLNNINLITCVPLHRVKKRERGYNQSELIGKHLAKALEIDFLADIIIRSKYSKSQTTLNIEERKENVKDIFTFNKKYSLENKNILLIDDVLTTGATLNSACKCLKEANFLFCLTIAKA